jgi:hypothetical protein
MAEAGSSLTPFQIQVARLFFTLDGSERFVLAGGAALAAHRLINRQTRDLDLFTSGDDASVEAIAESLASELAAADCLVAFTRSSATFTRLHVSSNDDELEIDLCVDAAAIDKPSMTFIGPTYAPNELAVRKLLALFARALPRDFADIWTLTKDGGFSDLVEQAPLHDPGFDKFVLAEMIGALDNFSDDRIPVAPKDVAALRDFFRRSVADLVSP